jgi:RNA-directed DNA polymerase
MQESYSERLAIHTGPESCGVVREDNVEALTGESAGRLFSRETSLRSADAFRVSGRHHRMRRYREAFSSSARSQTPSTHRSTSHGNREILRSPMSKMVWDASGSLRTYADDERT